MTPTTDTVLQICGLQQFLHPSRKTNSTGNEFYKIQQILNLPHIRPEYQEQIQQIKELTRGLSALDTEIHSSIIGKKCSTFNERDIQVLSKADSLKNYLVFLLRSLPDIETIACSSSREAFPPNDREPFAAAEPRFMMSASREPFSHETHAFPPF